LENLIDNQINNLKGMLSMATKPSTVKVKWVASTLMIGADSRGTPIAIGKWPEQDQEWKGMKASDLLLLAAASCSSYDVASILQKQRQPLESLEVICTGEQDTEPPNCFQKIHLKYLLKGKINPDKVARAIQLSEEKYCSVTNTLRKSVEIVSEFEIHH
jgi:putative redox protein